MNREDHDRILALARKLAEKARTDAAFKAQILSAPLETLTAMGLPEDSVSDFLRETGLADVTGYSMVCGLTVI